MTLTYLNQELILNLPEATLRLLEQRAHKEGLSLSQYGMILIAKGLVAEYATV